MAFNYDISFSPITSGTTNLAYSQCDRTSNSFAPVLFFETPKHADTKNTLTDNFVNVCLPSVKGSNSPEILETAPSPKIKIKGEEKNATVIVDTTKNILYHYDENGNADMAYLVATGSPNTPTDKIVKVVSHIENYPYRNAPASTKRRNNPKAYGPKIIILDKINIKTGEKTYHGEFIHGNNNPSSLGKNVSTGCIRMDNDAIKILCSQVKKGDIVIFK